MKYKQWLWQGSVAALLGVALTNSVAAQTNLSDTTGFSSSSSPFVSIGSTGSGVNIFGGGQNLYNPGTGRIDFAWLSDGLTIDPGVTLNTGGEGDGGEYGSTKCSGDLCQPSATETQKITLDEIAELLETDLERSLEQLALAEDAVEKAALEPRRIVRRGTARECVNPYIKARERVDRKLEQAEKFIELVDPINPENGMW